MKPELILNRPGCCLSSLFREKCRVTHQAEFQSVSLTVSPDVVAVYRLNLDLKEYRNHHKCFIAI